MIIIPTEKRIDWKRPPVVLITIVLLNLLVFTGYQSMDEQKLEGAVESYNKFGLLDLEGPIYQQYSQKGDDPRLAQQQLDDQWLVYYIVTDTNFSDYLQSRGQHEIAYEKRARWQQQRAVVDQLVEGLSHRAYGLTPNNLSLVTIFSHQFLHGDFMHLFGNMVFLFLVGFAVEASLGAWRFLCYYLVTGVSGGLLFAAIELLTGSGNTSLVGASGAVSGVMAMYVALFRLQKIEFFYWLFIFTGYFRSAAILILPFYVLKEVFYLFASEGSNVAFSAHIGGFISGAVLIYLTHRLSEHAIDTDYLQNDQDAHSPFNADLNSLYNKIGQFEFAEAWRSLRLMQREYPAKQRLTEIEYNLLKILDRNKAREFLLKNLGQAQSHKRIVRAQCELWRSMSSSEQDQIPVIVKTNFAMDLVAQEQLRLAEDLYKTLSTDASLGESTAVLARNIGMLHASQNRAGQAKKYYQQAQQLMQGQTINLLD